MRIDGWRIDGFGVFSDARVEGLPRGLTVVTGPNEAGKSTLLAFLRGVLFGFPDGRSRARRHEPVHGGRHGGAVTVLDESGARWVVERHLEQRSAALRGPDGALAEDHRLGALLGHADATLFANVFAFGLGELDSFELLDSDEVRDRVFAAGIVGGGRSARNALDSLDARRLALLRPRGRCDIRDLAEAARHASRDLASATAASRDLARRRDEVDGLLHAADAARLAVAECRAEVRRAVALLDAWPAHCRLVELEAEIAELDLPEGIDDDFASRVSAARAELAAADTALASAAEDAAAIRSRRDDTTTDDDIAAVSTEVEELAAELGAETARTARLIELDSIVEARRADLDGDLARLGPEWDRAHLAAFDVSIPAADEVRRRGEASTGLARALATARDESDSLRRQLGDIELQIAVIEADGATDRVEGTDDVERRARALHQLRSDVVDLGAETSRLDAAQGTLAGLSALTAEGGRGTSTVGLVFLGLGFLLLIIGSITAVGPGGPVAAGFVLTGLSALVLGVVSLMGQRSSAGPDVVAKLRGEQRDATRARDDIQARIELLRTRVQASAIVLGLPPDPSSDDVEECAEQIASEEARIQSRLDARERRGGLEAQAAKLREMLASASSDVAGLEVRVAADDAEWRRWKEERRVPVDLGVDAVNDLFTGIERSRVTLRDLEAAESERQRLDEASSAWRQRAAEVATRAGEAESGEPFADVRRLAERSAADASARRALTELTAMLADAESRAAAAEARHVDVTAQLADLWHQAGVADDPGADRVVTQWRRHRSMVADADAARASVAAAVGGAGGAEEIRSALTTGEVEEWERVRHTCELQLPELEAAHEEAIRAHRDAERALEELSRSADVADAGLQVEATRTRLADAVREWRTLTAARTIVADTLARYEQERQPAVLARAQRWFAQVTEDHYRTVTVADGDIVLIDHAGRRLTTDDLSRGTAEQLYLCLRFGLAAEMVSHTPLPFVMDDVLVNFDPVRTAHMAGVLASIAAEHQVLLFTCQPSSVEALLAAAPDARVIELPRHGGH